MSEINGPRRYTFYGRPARYDWDSVAASLGKRTDASIAAELGCRHQDVWRIRKMLRISRFRKVDEMRELFGKYPDQVIAEKVGAHPKTVGKLRRAEGVPPVRAPKWRDSARLQHARHMAAMEED